ncbi:MAG: hypothetical protein KF729_24540 [Sandaracinaceae bacterium]|nr:hypothetical protein [Sandaracinaceae bacterium]
MVLLGGGIARAQTSDAVALVTRGARAAEAAGAFATFVALDAARRFDEAPPTIPADVDWLVTIDTVDADAPLVRVWSRRTGVTLERRFEAQEDGYALAVVAAELLEVARTGADPRSVGATVEPAPPAPDPAPDPAPEPPAQPAPAPTTREARSAPAALAVTVGVGAEVWGAASAGGPWLAQPALFVELVGRPDGEGWVVGGALYASGLGAYAATSEGLDVRYARYEVGARISVGGELGPARTRLLGHARAGAAAVVASASRADGTQGGEHARAGWHLGVSLEGRQPLVAGLELTLELGADVLPAPVTLVADGARVLAEGPVRVGGRLGLAWCFE